MTLRLAGLRSTPLSRYLCALGTLRVLSEQHDSDLLGRWDRTTFCLEGVNAHELADFFLHRYSPAPIVSPWNKEGDPTQNKTTDAQLVVLANSEGVALSDYRATIHRLREVLDSPGWSELDKDSKVATWRSVAPDRALAWIDTAVVLTNNGAEFPALLGTGGNDGRFEMSRMYQREVVRLFADTRPAARRADWLDALLNDAPGIALADSSAGQFDPDATGGINTSAQGSARSASNPWAILLTMEGAICLRSASSSRLGFDRTSVAAAPFTVRKTEPGSLEAAGESHRSELWAPLWDRPTQWREVSSLLGEGRLAWKGRQASNSLDARRAVATLGTSRGIASFERFSFAERNGLAYVAVGAGRVDTTEVQGVELLAGLDSWMARVPRGDRASRQLSAATRRVERAQFDVADDGGSPESFQRLLVALAALEQAISRSGSAREHMPPLPAHALLPVAWAPVCNDASPESELALALASLRDPQPGPSDGPTGRRSASTLSMAMMLRGITTIQANRSFTWPTDPGADDPFARRRSASPILDALAERLRTAPTRSSVPAADAITALPAFALGTPVSLDTVSALLTGRLDFERSVRLAHGYALLGWGRGPTVGNAPPDSERNLRPVATPPWFAAARLCMLNGPVPTITDRHWSAGDTLVMPGSNWARLISSGRLSDLTDDAQVRLRRSGIDSASRLPPFSVDPQALAVALLCVLSTSDVRRLRATIDPAVRVGLTSASTTPGREHDHQPTTL